MKNQRGIGLEIEFQIVDKDSHIPVSTINEIPSIVFIQEMISKISKSYSPYIHAEQVSVLCEITSDVNFTLMNSYAQIQQIEFDINSKILQYFNLQLLARPVVKSKFEIVPASLDPNSRSHQLFNQWGEDQIIKTAICSMQINDSFIMRPFIDAENQLDFLRKQILCYQTNIDKYLSLNSGFTFNGQNRIEISTELLWGVKSSSFEFYGFQIDDLMMPSKVDNNLDVLKWMLAHNQINLDDHQLKSMDQHAVLQMINPKNVHGYFKFKFDPRNLDKDWILEHRFLDASTSIENAQRFHEVYYNDLECI